MADIGSGITIGGGISIAGGSAGGATTLTAGVDYSPGSAFANNFPFENFGVNVSGWTNIAGYNSVLAQPPGTVYTLSGSSNTYAFTLAFWSGEVGLGTFSPALPGSINIDTITFTPI